MPSLFTRTCAAARLPLALVAFVTSAARAGGQPAAQAQPSVLKTAALWFDAKATLGPFRGITHEATGETLTGATMAGTRGFVEFAAKSLTTDNGLRDHDMRKTLEVEAFPTIRFDLDSVAVRSQTPDSAFIELIGRMTIHGVSRAIRIPANLRRQPGEFRVRGSFELFVPAYGVTKLKRMLGTLSMDPTIRIGFDLTFNGAPAGAENQAR